jgi:hypothetical protein
MPTAQVQVEGTPRGLTQGAAARLANVALLRSILRGIPRAPEGGGQRNLQGLKAVTDTEVGAPVSRPVTTHGPLTRTLRLPVML